jgi:hypothetical protein
MSKRINLRSVIKATPRWAVLAWLLSLCSLFVLAWPAPQEEDDGTRRLWNKQFEAARARAKLPKPAAQTPATKTQPQAAALDDELIGITIWRLGAAAASADQSTPRLLVKKEGVQYRLERVVADTAFSEGQRLRLGIEVPRAGTSYVYVLDREIYADGSRSEPYLIFPAKSTPPGDEVITAGRLAYVPARNDPIPYFSLQRSRADHVIEQLTIIISPQPLGLVPGDGPLKLAAAQLARWEREWGGTPERREARSSAGREWTVAEKEAGEGTRKLVQGDPLPQTIYRVKAKAGQPVLVTVPLRIGQ